jgi:hypothetical protein
MTRLRPVSEEEATGTNRLVEASLVELDVSLIPD